MRDLDVYKKALECIETVKIYDVFDPYQLYEKIILQRVAEQVIAIYSSTDVDTDETYVALQKLLQDVFGMVQGTDLLALHEPQLLLSEFLLCIAEHISVKLGVNKYKLLFPSITVNNYVVTGTDLQTANVPLNTIVLSDDGTRVIEVFECLNLAEEDGVLKHTSLSETGEVLFLSEAEQSRVIKHSSATQAYWNAIQYKVKTVQNGLTIGSVLYKLSNQLNGGGVNRRLSTLSVEQRGALGQVYEMNAGDLANIGIQEFFTWFEQQSLAIQTKIKALAMESNGYTISMEEILARLANPAEPSLQTATYCVEMLASYIQGILHRNPNLFSESVDTVVVQHANTSCISYAIEEVNRTRNQLQRALQDLGNYTVKSSYNLLGDARLIETLANAKEYMSPADAAVFFNINHFLSIITGIFPNEEEAIDQYLFSLVQYRKNLVVDLKSIKAITWPDQPDVLYIALKHLIPSILALINTVEDLAIIEELDTLFFQTGMIARILASDRTLVIDKYPNLLHAVCVAYAIENDSLAQILDKLCANPCSFLHTMFMVRVLLGYLYATNNHSLLGLFANNLFGYFKSPKEMVKLISNYPINSKPKLYDFLYHPIATLITDLKYNDIKEVLETLQIVSTFPDVELTDYYQLGLAFKKGNIPAHPVGNLATTERALSCFRIPALMGDAKAQHNAGMMELSLANNMHIPSQRAKHLANARLWFMKAAAQGLAESQRNLERMQNQSQTTQPVANVSRPRQLNFTFVGEASAVQGIMQHREAIATALARHLAAASLEPANDRNAARTSSPRPHG